MTTNSFPRRRLAEVANKIQDGTHFSPRLGGGNFKYITSKNIGFGKLRLDSVDTISFEEHAKIYRRADTKFGDVLLTKDGANTGNAALNTFNEEISLLSSVAFIRANPKLAVESFILQYFLSGDGQRQITDSMAGNAITRLTLTKIKDLAVPAPNVDEQRRIGAVLGDVDSLMSSLERLIAKKRDIKQGMMQELLTGRTRLPGFGDPWQVRNVGNFAQVRAGGTPSTSVPRYWGGEIRWMSSGEIHQKRVREVTGRITTDGLRESPAQLLPVGTVLMALAGQGKTRGTVAVSRIELSTNQSIAGILPSEEHDSDFLYYNLDTRYSELRGESTGDGGRGGLNLAIIKKLDIYMPRIEEQRAIAHVIGDVDNELAALERRLESTRAIKQGMMQELLTGRIRLPVAEEVSV